MFVLTCPDDGEPPPADAPIVPFEQTNHQDSSKNVIDAGQQLHSDRSTSSRLSHPLIWFQLAKMRLPNWRGLVPRNGAAHCHLVQVT